VGISTSQASVLIYLGYHDKCRLTDHRRAKAVALTDAGWVLREQVMNEFRDFNDRLVKGLSESEISAVLKFLSLAPQNVGQKK